MLHQNVAINKLHFPFVPQRIFHYCSFLKAIPFFHIWTWSLGYVTSGSNYPSSLFQLCGGSLSDRLWKGWHEIISKPCLSSENPIFYKETSLYGAYKEWDSKTQVTPLTIRVKSVFNQVHTVGSHLHSSRRMVHVPGKAFWKYLCRRAIKSITEKWNDLLPDIILQLKTIILF